MMTGIQTSPADATTIARLRQRIPDATRPLPSAEVPARRRSAVLVTRQRQRRAEILCAARVQIADGYAEVNVRELARTVGVAVQTIYNLVGNKDRILSEAIDEHFLAITDAAREFGAQLGSFEALAEALWVGAMLNPIYQKNLNRAYFRRESVVHEVIRQRMRRAFRACLSSRLDLSRLEPAELDRTTEAMSALIAVSSFEWMADRIPLSGLRDRLHRDFDMVLRGMQPDAGAAFGLGN